MDALARSILEFIGRENTVFIIPPFQRNYDWDEEQCEELFKDIEFSFKNNKEHYLGNVIYFGGEHDRHEFPEYVLVDGQQRITTIVLLLCAIRDSIDDKELKQEINLYLKNKESQTENYYKIHQTSHDSTVFKSIVDNKFSGNEDNNIGKNYKFFLKALSETDISLSKFYKALNKLIIVRIDLEVKNDLETVQTVFEKINSTGKPLTAGDLIKNYLLLSTDLNEQKALYKNYWLEGIEKEVGNDNISLFAQNYLVLKTYKDVEKSKIYNDFKNYVFDSDNGKEEILKEMVKYAKYFKWINSGCCLEKDENKKELNTIKEIEKHIKELNALKTDDIYPLYMYLLNQLWNTNKNELKKIFKLLSDFFVRFRIVGPSGGGGAVRQLTHELLEKLNTEQIKPTENDIHEELSKQADSKRYPDDEEFKDSLKRSKKSNHTYGKVLLRKIEEFETKNISVSLDEITVEHFMPQTLSSKWKKYLGGNEESIRYQEQYLNCIGNLGIMSRGYNSENSNRPWDEKLPQIKNVQFNITNEVAKNKEWKEEQINLRNEDISNRACKAIKGPKPGMRKRIELSTEDGTYDVNELANHDMSNILLKQVFYKKQPLNINAWRNFFNKVCEIAYCQNPIKFEKLVSNNIVHKSTSNKSKKYNLKDKDPLISVKDDMLVEAKRINGSVYFSEGNLSASRAMIYSEKVLTEIGIEKDFQITIENEEDE